MSDAPHFCPGCGAERKAFPRYPWHFCTNCRRGATDGAGRRLVFGNVSASGGLCWRYATEDPDAAQVVRAVLCLIGGRPVLVREARFGGVVAEPLLSGPAPREALDLTRRDV